MYHSISKVEELVWGKAPAPEATEQRTVTMRTLVDEPPSVAHATPSFSFRFWYMPIEARDYVERPKT